MNLHDEARAAFHPGAWLRLKYALPSRFHALLDPIESRLYEKRGVDVTLGGQNVRLARDVPFPMATIYRSLGAEDIEDLAMMSCVFKALTPGGLFLDAGSHFGMYAVGAAAALGPRGRVIAFEPTAASVAHIRENLALNGFSSRVEIHQVAVASGPGTVEFEASGASCQNAIASMNAFSREGAPRPGVERIQVRTVALDEFFDPERSMVAKIDTEGAEIMALRGAPKLLASAARIFIELHPWGWGSESEGWKELQELAAAHGRSVLQLDGRPLEQPAHRRIELARAR